MANFQDKWPEMRMKHLELVQNAVTRMGANSAALKGYCMAIVAALIALAGAIDKPKVLFLGLPIVFVFAVLDAAYLSLERGFRNHYNDLRLTALDTAPDFNVITSGQAKLLSAFSSWSVAGFYGSAAIILIAVGLLM